jgi:hypothetical protein
MGKLSSIKLSPEVIAAMDTFEERKKEYDNFHYRLVGELVANMCILEELINNRILKYPELITYSFPILRPQK